MQFFTTTSPYCVLTQFFLGGVMRSLCVKEGGFGSAEKSPNTVILLMGYIFQLLHQDQSILI